MKSGFWKWWTWRNGEIDIDRERERERITEKDEDLRERRERQKFTKWKTGKYRTRNTKKARRNVPTIAKIELVRDRRTERKIEKQKLKWKSLSTTMKSDMKIGCNRASFVEISVCPMAFDLSSSFVLKLWLVLVFHLLFGLYTNSVIGWVFK